MTDEAALADLVVFARIEVESRDVEPWADLLGELYRQNAVDTEQLLWMIKLYNAYDDMGSAVGAFERWPGPYAWATSAHSAEARDFPCTQERRNLRGGKILRHLDSYVAYLAGDRQESWTFRTIEGGKPEADFQRLTQHLRKIWGTGRQAAFEWAEFLGKAARADVAAGDAQLWESEGPRRSLQRLYGNPNPGPAWLDWAADTCRNHLTAQGVALSWEDFETIICDFNVMRDGRYYPGRHLAALREEINGAPSGLRALLDAAWSAVVPERWRDIPPGIVKEYLPVYRDTGIIRSTP